MKNLQAFLAGKKSYILAVGIALYAVGGFLTGKIDLVNAAGLIWGGATVASVRAAIAKVIVANVTK